MAVSKGLSLSVEDAWNAVALEERLELLARSKAQGWTATLVFWLIAGAVAYGFDQPLVLAGGFGCGLLVMPLFSSYTWRNEKPEMILSYLAVRSVARKYGYAFSLPSLDIVLIFKGEIEERYSSKEAEELVRQKQVIDFETSIESKRKVWVVLMRGGVVILSERPGGAKLEFLSAVHPDAEIRKPLPTDEAPDEAVILIGADSSKSKRIVLTSRFPGALYVFEKQFGKLIHEATEIRDKIEKLRRREAEEKAVALAQRGR